MTLRSVANSFFLHPPSEALHQGARVEVDFELAADQHAGHWADFLAEQVFDALELRAGQGGHGCGGAAARRLGELAPTSRLWSSWTRPCLSINRPCGWKSTSATGEACATAWRNVANASSRFGAAKPMTRCAMLMPPPTTLARPLMSAMGRRRKAMVADRASSALLEKHRATPWPVSSARRCAAGTHCSTRPTR